MHIVFMTIGERGGMGNPPLDYSTIDAWHASLIDDSTKLNVGVMHDCVEGHSHPYHAEGYKNMLNWEERSSTSKSNFVLMTETGVVLVSRIADRIHKLYSSFPPIQYDSPSVLDRMYPEAMLGPPGIGQSLEDVARKYINQRLDEYDQTIDRSEVQLAIQSCSHALARLISDNPNCLNEIEWRDLERILAEAFSAIGFTVELTPPSKDGGKDIILECCPPSGRRTYFVEVKHWRSTKRVGATYIKDFHQVVVREKVCGGLFLSTYGVAANALQQLTEVERRHIRVGTEAKVVSLCRSYVYSTNGFILPSTQLPDFLFADTLPS